MSANGRESQRPRMRMTMNCKWMITNDVKSWNTGFSVICDYALLGLLFLDLTESPRGWVAQALEFIFGFSFGKSKRYNQIYYKKEHECRWKTWERKQMRMTTKENEHEWEWQRIRLKKAQMRTTKNDNEQWQWIATDWQRMAMNEHEWARIQMTTNENENIWEWTNGSGNEW